MGDDNHTTPTEATEKPAASRWFHILDLEGSQRVDHCIWWRPNGAGYTTDLAQAGLFDAETIADNPTYYNDGVKTAAVPVPAVEDAAVRVVPQGYVTRFRRLAQQNSQARVPSA